MAISQADRIAFSKLIVTTNAKVASIQTTQATLSSSIAQAQSVDTANNNLLIPVNDLVNLYQNEIQYLDGNQRTSFTETDMQNAAKKVIQNDFFPNDSTVVVPSLASTKYIWGQFAPYALNFAIGKNYSESYTTITYETGLINTLLSDIATITSTYQDIEATSGQMANNSAGGIGGGDEDEVVTYPAVQAAMTSMLAIANSLSSILTTELAAIPTTDPNNATINEAAATNLSGTFIPALNAWLAYPNFNPVPADITSYAAFYAYNPSLLAPTKLHSAQLTALSAALNARLTFITTRLSQLNIILGSITQDITTGNIISSSGLYGQRYSYLNLRLNVLTGSLSILLAYQNSYNAQSSQISSLQANQMTYLGVVPTTALSASATGTSTIQVTSSSLFSNGDTVYIMADTQTELTRAIASINGNSIVLNDIVPSKYQVTDNLRMYKTS